jgi:uncharacterized RDD family membrane protein YckC
MEDNDLESNNFKAPEAELLSEDSNSGPELASRWARLWGSLIDTVIMLVVLIPVMFVTGFMAALQSGTDPSFLFTIFMFLISVCVFLAFNFKLLKNNGQTIGKKVMGTKIVGLNNEKALMEDHILKRYLTYFVPGQIPIIGTLFSLVNILFIFGAEKRCIHDLAGKTKVVKC